MPTTITAMAEPALPRTSTPAHLRSIDATAWPGVASVPDGRAVALKARRAEAGFAKACDKAGIALTGATPDLVVERAEVFARVAKSGWVGLAEGYMAGEWGTESSQVLVDVLFSLIGADYRPKTPPAAQPASAAGGDLPPELVSHFAGDGMSAFQGIFATGVPTTQRQRLKSHARGAGRGDEPAHHFVDVTEIGPALDTDRGDLADAQGRSVDVLLRSLNVRRGSHVLEFPGSGGAVALRATAQQATVDVAVIDEYAAAALREQLLLGGAEGGVRIDVSGGEERFATARADVFDAIVGMEKLEALGEKERIRYLRSAETMLAPHGRLGLQTILRTDAYSGAAGSALESLRAYVWPGLHFSSDTEFAKLVDRETGLRVVGVTRAPEHLAASLRLQRMMFDAHLRDAAADGYDIVFRRLWTWQFALREALARLGMLDLAQVVLVRRARRERR